MATRLNRLREKAMDFALLWQFGSALTMLDSAREQTTDQLPANNWLTNNFTLAIIRAKMVANKANAS
jgi:hypothetical protein